LANLILLAFDAGADHQAVQFESFGLRRLSSSAAGPDGPAARRLVFGDVAVDPAAPVAVGTGRST
jgi:hypothetical protein